MIRVLLDTDIILDIYLERLAFLEPAARIWLAHERGELQALVSAVTPVNLYYIGRKLVGKEKARLAVRELLGTFNVASLTHDSLLSAIDLQFNDFEDAVQHASATYSGCEAIITRNTMDYKGATINVFAPPEFIQMYPQYFRHEGGDS